MNKIFRLSTLAFWLVVIIVICALVKKDGDDYESFVSRQDYIDNH